MCRVGNLGQNYAAHIGHGITACIDQLPQSYLQPGKLFQFQHS